MALGLEVLTALAEEGSALERRRRNEVLPVLVRRSAEVLALVSAAMTGRLGQGEVPKLYLDALSLVQHTAGAHAGLILYKSAAAGMRGLPHLALRCARAWLDLDMDGCGTFSLSAGNLCTSQVCHPPGPSCLTCYQG